MIIRLVNENDFFNWLDMRCDLWPSCNIEEQKKEMIEISENLDLTPVFVAESEGELVGFLEASIHDYAPGCHTNNIGYIEGWYVKEKYRKLGIGKMLVEACEKWALSKGFMEVASDALVDNDVSIKAHQKLGYELIGKDTYEAKFLKEINISETICNNKEQLMHYKCRKGSYAIIFNDCYEVAIIKTPRGYFLPGGKMEGLENYKENLEREIIEELGYKCLISKFLTKVTEYKYITRNESYTHFIGYFYLVKLLDKVCDKIETDHELIWLSYHEALTLLKPTYQIEALKQFNIK